MVFRFRIGRASPCGKRTHEKGTVTLRRSWSATANIEFADVVRQVHQDYLRVGADIITSNNFWTAPTRLERCGLGR